MDPDESDLESRMRARSTSSSVPIFDTTADLVEFSLGISRHDEAEDSNSNVALVDDNGHEVMDVDEEIYDDNDDDGDGGEVRGDSEPGRSQELTAYYNASEQDERIRVVTTEYLEGRLSLLEFAAAIEHYGRLGPEGESEQYQDEDDGDEEPGPSSSQNDVDVKRPIPSLVLLNPEKVEFTSSKPQPSTSQQSFTEAESLKLRGEFFRSGDEPATFSIRKRRKMPPTIKNLMGEAHVRFARGDLVGAETICMEVIKEQPTYKDPFHTLAMIYENQGNRSKSLQFYLICALLDPKRFEEWPRLAEMSVEEENVQQAIMCLTKALTKEPGNIKLHFKRCQLLKESGDTKSALKGYQKVYQLITDGKEKLEIAKDMAYIYFQMEEMENAYEILAKAFQELPDHVTSYELNLLAEVCISIKKYVEALDAFIKHGNLVFSPPIEQEDFQSRAALTKALIDPERELTVPLDMHSDLVQKVAQVLIHLEAFRLADQIVNRLLAIEDINDFGLQFFEIAEAYISKKENRAALQILNPLINSENFSEAEVWLRYAECLYMINKLEDAAEAYEKVISLAPNHKIAKLNLSIILQKMGKYEGALESLDQNNLEDLIDHDLLLERCKIFLNQGRIPEFYETALQLFSRHCPIIRDSDEAEVLIMTSNQMSQLEGLSNLRMRKGEPVSDVAVEFEEKPFENPFREWKIYIMLMRIFLATGRYDLLQRVSYTVWASKLFSIEPEMKQEVDFHTAFAAAINGDQELTPLHFRTLYASHRLSTVMINMLSLAFRKNSKFKYSKQIIRLLKKHPSDLRLMLLSAHTSFSTGSYKYALIEYLQIITEIPTHALCHLMVAITLMHMVSQRTTSNRMRLVLYMIGFLRKYMELRGRCQESYYNVARAYHFIGFYSQALRYYKKVLTTEPVVDDKFYGGVPAKDDGTELFAFDNSLDLTQEAAYNIAHIYKLLGLHSQARMYLLNYITI